MVLVEILIVEDERLVGFDLRRRLSRMGYTVVGITASGEEAIEHANRLRPDIVLMDVRLRGPMDGIEAAQQNLGSVPDPRGVYVGVHHGRDPGARLADNAVGLSLETVFRGSTAHSSGTNIGDPLAGRLCQSPKRQAP